MTLLAVLGLLSCSISPQPSTPEGKLEVARPGAPAEGPSGVIEGRVLFDGARIPYSTKVENTTDTDHCGRAEWGEKAEELRARGLLTGVCLSPLAVYCDAFAAYRELAQAHRPRFRRPGQQAVL